MSDLPKGSLKATIQTMLTEKMWMKYLNITSKRDILVRI